MFIMIMVCVLGTGNCDQMPGFMHTTYEYANQAACTIETVAMNAGLPEMSPMVWICLPKDK